MGDLRRVRQSDAIKPGMVSTLLTPPPGFVIEQQFGIVRGITVRSRNVIASIGAGFKAMVGGRIETFITMCEDARVEAYNHMVEHAAGMGANAVLGMSYDTTDLEPGITEVLCLGTAVRLAPA